MDLTQLRKHQLEELQKKVGKELKRRYKKRRTPKYGLLNKGFTQDELAKFISQVKHIKAKTIFVLMKGLGLRIGEAVSIHERDLDLVQRRLWIHSEKESHPTMFFLHDEVYEQLKEYYAIYGESIKAAGYVFPSIKKSNKFPHLSPHWARNHFRMVCKEIGMNFSYDFSEEKEGRTPRSLHRLTTHSFRHSFCKKVWSTTHDFYITQRLSRHKNPRHLERYIHLDQEEIDQAIVTVFNK